MAGAAGLPEKVPKGRHDPWRIARRECSGDVALGRLVPAGADLGCRQIETVQREPLACASGQQVSAAGGEVGARVFAGGD